MKPMENTTVTEIEQMKIDERITRAATSWTAAFPDRKEVSRRVAKQARAMMNAARRENIRPSEVRFCDAGIDDGVEFLVGLSCPAWRIEAD
jgi:hypothetical protein